MLSFPLLFSLAWLFKVFTDSVQRERHWKIERNLKKLIFVAQVSRHCAYDKLFLVKLVNRCEFVKGFTFAAANIYIILFRLYTSTPEVGFFYKLQVKILLYPCVYNAACCFLEFSICRGYMNFLSRASGKCSTGDLSAGFTLDDYFRREASILSFEYIKSLFLSVLSVNFILLS